MNKKQAFLLTTLALCTASAIGGEIETGMWGIDEELNGQPGRGIQIDHQGGDRMIVTYFGYRADGSALFLQSSGERNGNVYEGELAEYQGGTPLGGPTANGQLLAGRGRIRLDFSSAAAGTITLPGEAAKAMRRLDFENHAKRFTIAGFSGVSFPHTHALPQLAYFRFTLDASQFHLKTSLQGLPGYECHFYGSYEPAGKGILARGSAGCSGNGNFESFQYKTGLLTVTDDGTYQGRIFRYQADGTWTLWETHVAVCSAGAGFGNYVPRCLPPSPIDRD